MFSLEVGSLLKSRCKSCYHNEMQVIKIIPKEFTRRVAFVVWMQCPECGQNDNSLTQIR